MPILCFVPGIFQGKAEWGFEKSVLGEGVPALGSGVGTGWSVKVLRSPNHSMILFLREDTGDKFFSCVTR